MRGNDDWMYAAEQRLREHEEAKRMLAKKSSQIQGYAQTDDEDQAFCVRVPDDFDNLFDEDENLDDSPYVEEARRARDSRLNSLTEEQKRFAKNAFSAFLTLSIVLASLFVYGDTLFPEKNDLYYFQMGFNAELPEQLTEAYLEWDENLDMDTTTPVFWNIPMSGGDVVEDIVASCLKLVQASEVGGLVHEGYAKTIEIVNVFGDSYVNVDTTTPDGIVHASSMRLAESGLADVVFTPMVHEPTQLFLTSNRDGNGKDHFGYMFTIIRHPVERAVSLYYYLKESPWDDQVARAFESMSLEDYARSQYVENNWMTRILSNHKGGALTDENVRTAKEVLRRKVLVGMFDDMKFSMKRFEKRFGWYAADEETEACEAAIIANKMDRYLEHPAVQEGTGVWNLIVKQNKYDMELFKFAELLFMNQRNDVSD